MRAGPQLSFFTHPGASANLTAQQWVCKQPRCVRLLRLWPTLPFSRRLFIILMMNRYLALYGYKKSPRVSDDGNAWIFAFAKMTKAQ